MFAVTKTCVLLAVLSCTFAQVIFSTRGTFKNERSSGTNSSYNKLYVPHATNMITTSADTRFHMADATSFKELCEFTTYIIVKLEAVMKSEFNCIDFFTNETLIKLIQTPNSTIQYRPTTFNGFQSAYKATWWAPLFDIRNYCYYCYHDYRDELLALVEDHKLPYFWKHSRYVGNDDKNTEENPTILAKVHHKYLDWYNAQGRTDMIGRAPENNLTDFLYLTRQRNKYKDDVGEENREEYPYNIYCSSWNLWGTKCDSYVWFWNPFRYGAWPIMDYIARVTLLIGMLILLWIPSINHHAKTNIKEITSIPHFIYELFADVKLQCVLFMTLGIALIIVEDSADFKTTQIAFYNWHGVFRIAAGASTAMGFFALLVLWSHICHSTEYMDDKMNLGNKFVLGFLYASVVLMCIVSAILYDVLKDYRSWVFICEICFAAAYFLFIIFGFLLYGMSMLFVLKKSESNEVYFLKLRFTKFMIIIMVLFMHYICWMVIVAVENAAPGKMGLFLAMMKGPIVDFASLLLYPFVIYLLFDSPKFFGIYDAIKDGLLGLRERFDGKSHVRLQDEEELEAGL